MDLPRRAARRGSKPDQTSRCAGRLKNYNFRHPPVKRCGMPTYSVFTPFKHELLKSRRNIWFSMLAFIPEHVKNTRKCLSSFILKQ